MLTRLTQFGLAVALVSFAGLSTAQAQDEDPCMDDPCADPCEDDPCADPCGDGDPCGDPCGDGDPCGGGDEGGDAMDGEGMAAPPMVTPKGKTAINVAIGINLSDEDKALGKTGDPINISPDVSYGVMPKLDVGLYHSNYGLTGFWFEGLLGGGLCVAGDVCAEVYNGPTGILGRYELTNGKLSAAGNGGIVLSNISDDADMGIRLKIGADVRYMLNEKMVITVHPNVHVSVVKDDMVPFADKHQLYIPLGLMYAVNEKIHAGVQTGIAALDVAEVGDTYFLPISFGAMMKIDEKLSVGGAIALPILASGFDNVPDGAADHRTLTMFAKYNL